MTSPFEPSLRRVASIVATAFLAAVLAGCAVVSNVQPGLPEPELIATYGQPTARHPLSDGSSNYEYSLQPMGQFLWMVRVRDGRVESVQQVLTDREFATVNVGTDTRETILAHFGSPAEIIHLSLSQREAWSYRYKVDNVFPALMTVQFDPQGIVREVFSGNDPLFDGGRNGGSGGGQR